MWRRSLDLISQALPLGTGLAHMAALVSEHMRVDRCAVLLYDRTTDELTLQVDRSDRSAPEARLRLGVGLTGLAASGQRPAHDPGAAHGERPPLGRSRP